MPQHLVSNLLACCVVNRGSLESVTLLSSLVQTLSDFIESVRQLNVSYTLELSEKANTDIWVWFWELLIYLTWGMAWSLRFFKVPSVTLIWNQDWEPLFWSQSHKPKHKSMNQGTRCHRGFVNLRWAITQISPHHEGQSDLPFKTQSEQEYVNIW